MRITLPETCAGLCFLPFLLIFWGLLTWRFTLEYDYDSDIFGNKGCTNKRTGLKVEACEAKMITFYVFLSIFLITPLFLIWKVFRCSKPDLHGGHIKGQISEFLDSIKSSSRITWILVTYCCLGMFIYCSFLGHLVADWAWFAIEWDCDSWTNPSGVFFARFFAALGGFLLGFVILAPINFVFIYFLFKLMFWFLGCFCGTFCACVGSGGGSGDDESGSSGAVVGVLMVEETTITVET